MMDLSQMRHEFESWSAYVRNLALISESDQLKPLAEGKWAVRDVLAHMWKWDVFFWEHAIRPLTREMPLTYHHLDYNAFNDNAKHECRTLDWSYLIEETAKMRDQIAGAIHAVPEAEYERIYSDADGNPFSIKAYLEDFVHHDAHHRGQIEAVLKAN